jgi:thiol:disulfide interchange protein DsbC
MRKHPVSILLVTAIFMAISGIFGTCLAAGKPDACKGITMQALRARVPIPPAAILSKRDVNGVCEVILDIRGEFVPVYAGKDYVIAGEMYQARKQITQATISGLKAKRFTSLKPEVEKCVAMTLKPKGKAVSQTVYMITDPVCPFCHRAETRLKEFTQKYGAAFKIVFNSVHPPVGTQKAIEAVCRGLSAEDYLKGAWKKDNKTQQYQCPKGTELIKRSESVTKKLGVRGVPVFYLENGETVVGANIPALARALSKKSVKVSYAK